MRSHGIETAGRLALQALADGIDHAAVLHLSGLARYDEGRNDEALQLLKRARAQAPKDPHVLNSLAMCLAALGETGPALQAYNSALRLNPAMAAVHFNRGMLLETIQDVRGARASFERAAELDRNYANPIASLAWMDAIAGDKVRARALAQRALALSPGNLLARMALASADLQLGERAAASEGLDALVRDPAVTGVNRSIVLGLIGDLHDAEGRPAEAFAAYAVSNAELRALYAPQYEAPGQETALGQAERLAAWFEQADVALWREVQLPRPRASDPKAHIFLVGFPRSGTTLLENVLAAHPEVVTLEEKDSLASIAQEFLGSPDGLDRLAHLSSAEAARKRDAYWSSVRGCGAEPRGRVFIDKMPLASVLLPVIAKLFPNARILFALRDPRDVVLSCFRRRFGMNESMYQLLTLGGAAAYYDAVMRLSETYRHVLALAQHPVRYESLVDDFEGTVRSACSFIGLDWDPTMADFAGKARSRDIATPSAAQVARGLNREGQGVWRRYQQQMAPVLPTLEPWVERFGYAAPGG